MITRKEQQDYDFDNFFGFCPERPVFVKIPFKAFGREWKRGDEYTWLDQQFRAEEFETIAKNVKLMYDHGKLHHDRRMEVKNKVGDRLYEMNGKQMYRLVVQMNSILKKRTSTKKQYDELRCKVSKIDHKQRLLIRRFLDQNPWIWDEFVNYRDYILTSTQKVETKEDA